MSVFVSFDVPYSLDTIPPPVDVLSSHTAFILSLYLSYTRCFIVTLSSTSDELSGWLPPLDSSQHARANVNIVIIIAPRRDYTSFHTRECQECEVEIFVSGSGGGAATKLREASLHKHFSGVSGICPDLFIPIYILL